MSGVKIILRNLGMVLIIVGIFNLLTLIISFYYHEYDALVWIWLTSILLWLMGGVLFLIGRKAAETQLRHAVATAGLSWIIIPLVTTIPFILISNMDFLSGFFESMSGWTTTGLTMVGGNEAFLSHTIQFYRFFT